MNSRYHPSEISLISAPVTSANLRNARNHPALDLGCCTPFQLLSRADISHQGTVCILGNPSRGLAVARAMIRRSRKPFLFLGTASDKDALSSPLDPDWTQDIPQCPDWTQGSVPFHLPEGNGALLFSRPNAVYLALCAYLEVCPQDRFLILHLGSGLQINVEALNLLSAAGQCLILCDSIPQSICETESRTVTALEFMKKMTYLLVFHSGSASKDLVSLLPTYRYETVTNTTAFNTYSGRSILHPFRGHRGHGVSVGQTRSTDFRKCAFEEDDLTRIFDEGYALVYNAKTNSVYLARMI